MLTSQSSYSEMARRLSEIASQQAATAKGLGLTSSALGFESWSKTWEGYAGENIQGNGFGRAPQIINSPNELTYLNSYGQNNPFSWGIPGNGPKSGGAPLSGGGDSTVYNEYGGTSTLPTLWGNTNSQYGEAQGGSQYLESQPWGQQGLPGLAADTNSAVAWGGYSDGGGSGLLGGNSDNGGHPQGWLTPKEDLSIYPGMEPSGWSPDSVQHGYTSNDNRFTGNIDPNAGAPTELGTMGAQLARMNNLLGQFNNPSPQDGQWAMDRNLLGRY